MLKENARFFSAGLLGAELGVLAVSFVAAHQATWYQVAWRKGWDYANSYATVHSLERYLPLLLVGMAVWAAHSVWSRSRRLRPISDELNEVIARTVGIAIATMAAVFIWRIDADSRVFVGVWCALLLVSQLGLRFVIRMALREARNRGYNFRRVAIVGTSQIASRVADAVQRHNEWGLQLAGFITTGGERPPSGAVSLGPLSNVAQIVDNQVIDEVIFCAQSGALERYEKALTACEEAGVNTRLVLDFFPHKFSRMELDDLEGLPMLTFHATSNDPFPLLAKRVFDLTVSLAAVVLGAPIFLLVGLAVKASSKGPVFFVQERVGLNGRAFNLYKFRSMVVDAEAQKAAILAMNERDGPAFKMTHDPRVTPVGRFIRKTSLDEIPQFFNVLLGEMSIVGPRPPLPDEVARYERWQRRRLSVKPGITCIWQISNRGDTDFDTWMQQDLEYIDNWSMWLDVKIFLQTIPAVLLSRGAS